MHEVQQQQRLGLQAMNVERHVADTTRVDDSADGNQQCNFISAAG